MLKSNRPENGIRIRKYAELTPWMEAFGRGDINLMFLTGTHGLGKTRLVREALKERDYLLLEGHATPLKTYAQLFHHRDKLVVIDDEDSFHADATKIRLMKCLCSTEPTKRVTWESTSKLLAEMELPSAFETTSKVAVLSNSVGTVNPHVAALFDRGSVLSFEPSTSEIHDRVASWVSDREIYDFIGRWLNIIPALSMRHYVKAAEMKRAGINWQDTLLQQWKAGKMALIDALQNDPSLCTEEERSVAFEKRGGGKRATYFRHLAKWRRANTPSQQQPSSDIPEDLDQPLAVV